MTRLRIRLRAHRYAKAVAKARDRELIQFWADMCAGVL